MDIESVRQIVAQAGKWVAGIFGTLGGFAGIVSIVKLLVSLKKSKMSEKDKADIANIVANQVVSGQNLNLEVDISGQIDKATNKHIAVLEGKTNTFIRLVKRLLKQQKLVMSAMSDFKTISNDNRLALLAETAVEIEEPDEIIPETTTVSISPKEETKAPSLY